MTVNILGTEYTVEIKEYDKDEAFERGSIDGYCDSWLKKIVVCDMETMPNFENEPKETCIAAQKETLRHEIVHAFFDESGLGDSAIRYSDRSWSKNEEMVDWWALQGVKVYKAWESVGAV